MSLETWKAEFYPIEAEDVPVEQAIDHSLTKWIGLRAENLARHALEIDTYGMLVEIADNNKVMELGGSNCALCACYHDDEAYDYDLDEDAPCQECPLAIVRGGVACDDTRESEERSPWSDWNNNPTERRNPEPMIMWLTKTKAEFFPSP